MPPDKTASASARRPPDWTAVEESLGLLARAVQQFHTYPATSPLCVSAIEACQRALAGLSGRDQLTCRVTPVELVVDHVSTGRGTQVGHELARRLHRASVAAVVIERAVTARELARFCEDLLRCGERGGSDMPLPERLTEHGVERITIEMAGTPAVLSLPAAGPEALEHARREHARFDEQMARGGAINHLYPPQKGWVRLDAPGAPSSISLLDLAVLADDPAAFASMLLRLTDEDDPGISAGAALEKKYSDVTMVISALNPQAARRMLSKLARAVLDLDPGTRQSLLRRTVLPGLLDGRIDGAILREFPDLELSESLCLLLDLETAAPELLMTALSRLELSPERHAAMVPLLDARLKERESSASDRERETTLARHARELVRIEAPGKSFAEFSAFDLSLDGEASRALERIRAVVPQSDVLAEQLTCLWHLICLEPNPDTIGRFLDRAFVLLAELENAHRGEELPGWLRRFRELAQRLWEPRPDVAAVLTSQLTAFCTPQRATWIADLALCEPGGRDAAAAMVHALGPAVAAPLVDVLERGAAAPEGAREGIRTAQNRARAVAQLLVDHAPDLAPALAPLLDSASATVQRTLLRVLGCAGRGFERAVEPLVASREEATAREALRALARIGTQEAAAIVVREIEQQRGASSVAAEETLWHFPVEEAQRRTRDLLGRREFTVRHPQASERLLDRAARVGGGGLEPVLQELAPLRFRIWKPAVARVARKAHLMLHKG